MSDESHLPKNQVSASFQLVLLSAPATFSSVYGALLRFRRAFSIPTGPRLLVGYDFHPLGNAIVWLVSLTEGE
jgi:hypothetical protein